MRHLRIQNALNENLKSIAHLELVDESHQHAGRTGQESHFKLVVVSDDFKGKNRVQRQREINTLLKAEFDGGLHALSMRLMTPEEWEKQTADFQTPDCAGKSTE